MTVVICKENIRASIELTAIYHQILDVIWVLLNHEHVSEDTLKLALDLATTVQENIGTLVLSRNV